MVSTVRSRPNHYETLGLNPTATPEDISHAFARELRRPRPFGGIALLGLAYETLRDATKRRAYDSSIGIAPPPQLQPQPAPTYRLSPPVGAPFLRAATARPTEQIAIATSEPPVATGNGRPQPDLSSERRLPAFIAAGLRDLAKREPLDEAAPRKVEPEQPRRSEADLTFEQQERDQQATAHAGEFHRALEQSLDARDDGPVDWKRPIMIIGAAVAAASLIGIWARSDVGKGQPPEQLQPTTQAWLPPARPAAKRVGEATTVAAPAVETRPQGRIRPPGAAPPRVAGRPSDKQLTSPTAQQTSEPSDAGLSQVEASQAPPAATTPAVADSTPASSAAASLPLPRNVIARTIERIGYACGQVSSTAAVGPGTPGVFKVTCTSGQAYVASPVRGRYHFRRLNR